MHVTAVVDLCFLLSFAFNCYMELLALSCKGQVIYSFQACTQPTFTVMCRKTDAKVTGD